MSQTAAQRPKKALLIVVALGLVAVVAFALWRLGRDDQATPLSAGTQGTTEPFTTIPTSEATTSKRAPKATAAPTCEGPGTLFNVEGVEQDSLLPDCGVTPVSTGQQQKSGLGLGCGGTYPVILYKTTTTNAKTSICGKDASGESFRFVTRPTGGEVIDLPGSYASQLDAFVAKQNGTSFTVQAYDGTLLIRKNGSTTTQKSSEFISLDNESDYD
ncbi:hypothetical protein [Aeromicrobium sp.]|uniref:hypothetical protein n=1 Tax=Aeromicrobium sp. TaxID=1871063 RepID=UPI003C47EDA7